MTAWGAKQEDSAQCGVGKLCVEVSGRPKGRGRPIASAERDLRRAVHHGPSAKCESRTSTSPASASRRNRRRSETCYACLSC